MKKIILSSLIGLSATFGIATDAWGHAVQTDYFVDLFAAELSLELTATYSSGEPMQEAQVLVYAPNEQATPWLTSETDASGNFTFEPDESLPGEWRIEFKKEGHQDMLLVPVDDRGIDYINITQTENRDVHYAGGLASVAIGVLALASGLVIVAKKRA